MASNRYDFMTPGTTQDSKTGSFYPDPLSLNYLNFKMTEVPYADKFDTKACREPWKEMISVYGKPAFDDVVLTLNGVSHSNFLQEGQIVYIPKEEDITNSFKDTRS